MYLKKGCRRQAQLEKATKEAAQEETLPQLGPQLGQEAAKAPQVE